MEYKPLTWAEKWVGANSFENTGNECLIKEDFDLARVFLGMAWHIYKDVGDRKKADAIFPKYKEVCERTGITP